MSTPSPEELERRRALVRSFSERITGPGTVRFDGFAADFRWRMIGATPVSGTSVGVEGISATMRPFRERMAALEVVVDDVICEGDRCVKLAHSEGRTADGRPYRNEYATVFTFEDGVIVQVVEYLDTQLMASVFED